MNAIPPTITPGSASPFIFGRMAASALSRKWAALHRAAQVIATLAGLEPESATPEIQDFPASIHDAAPWRRDLAERGIDDIVATMQPGISALLSIDAGGGDPRAAAMALWHEFMEARAAVVALLRSEIETLSEG
jgi:hypothetical protein